MNNSEAFIMLSIWAAFLIGGIIAWRRSHRKLAVVLWVPLVVLVAGSILDSGHLPSQKREMRKNACVAGLRQLEGGIQQWAETTRKSPEDAVDVQAVLALTRQGRMPECPGGGSYSFGKVKDVPRCSLAAEGHTLQPSTPPDRTNQP